MKRTSGGSVVLLALQCLAILGCGNSVDRLISQLGDPDVEIRRAAARELGEHRVFDKRVVVAFAQSVADEDAEVQRLSIDALGRLGPSAKSSVPALKPALTDEDQRVRVRAAVAICKIAPEEPSYVPVLVSAMRAGEGQILLQVGAMGPDAGWAVPTLIDLLSHDSPQMRALAAQTLGHIGPSANEATRALQHAVRDPNFAVQRAARGALARIQGKSEEAKTQAEL